MIVACERKIVEANRRLAMVQQAPDKRAAAEYLVEQIRVGAEEKATLIGDNQTMAVQIQELLQEREKLKDDLKIFNLVKEVPDDPLQATILNT